MEGLQLLFLKFDRWELGRTCLCDRYGRIEMPAVPRALLWLLPIVCMILVIYTSLKRLSSSAIHVIFILGSVDLAYQLYLATTDEST